MIESKNETTVAVSEGKGATRRGFLASMLGAGFVLATPTITRTAAAAEPVAAGAAGNTTPQRVLLSIGEDPSRGVSVTWRSPQAVGTPQGQIVPLSADPAVTKQPQTVNGIAIAEKATEGQEARHYALSFSGLEPGRSYCYRVGDGTTWSEWNIFETALATPAPFRFLYLGDVQNDIRALCSRMVRYSSRRLPDARFILCAGDLVTEGCSDALWEEFTEAFSVTGYMTPLLPTPGNHDTHHATEEEDKAFPYGAAIQYHAHFHLPENGPKESPELKQEAYYVDYQGVRIISVNSNVFSDDRPTNEAHEVAWESQLKWLESVLSNNPNRWTIATHHHPIYSTSKNRDNKIMRDLLQPLYQKYGVDLVLQGHDHSYGRTHKVWDSKVVDPSAKGIIYAVSVSGPKMYELKPKFAQLMACTTGNKQLYQSVSIDGDTLTYESHGIDGQRIDGFQLKKDASGSTVYRDQQTV